MTYLDNILDLVCLISPSMPAMQWPVADTMVVLELLRMAALFAGLSAGGCLVGFGVAGMWDER